MSSPSFKMAFGNLKDFAQSYPLLLSGSIVLVMILLIPFLITQPKKLDLPVVGAGNIKDSRQVLMEGISKYPDSPFIVTETNKPPLVILPISVINEVKSLPENKASLMKEVRREFPHTGIGVDRPGVIDAVKFDLTRNIASTLDGLQDEIRYGFDKEFGPCEDWTAVPLYQKMARVVALLSGRVFVGRPLSREEEWINATVMFTFLASMVKDAVNAYPKYLRDIVAPFLDKVKDLKQFKKRAGDLLKPILDAQLAKEGNGKLHRDDSVDEQGTFISWILNRMKPKERDDPLGLIETQMGLSFAAIHTTTMAATAAIYDLTAHPEYIQPLRDEIQQVIDEDGQDVDESGFTYIKKSSMPKLWKLDSFLKESQRLTPPGLVSNLRVAITSITLSTGLALPPGTRFALSSWAIHNSPSNPIFTPTSPPPTTFDGLRFYNLRQIPGNENKHQFVTSSPDSLNFGHGIHACPGRFFASNEIKVVLIELLRNWEFRFKGDVEMRGGEERRPKNGYKDTTVMPDTQAEMEFRRKKV